MRVGVGSSAGGAVVVVAPSATCEAVTGEAPEAKELVTGTAISAAAATPTAAPVSLRLDAGPLKRLGLGKGGNRFVTELTFLEKITRQTTENHRMNSVSDSRPFSFRYTIATSKAVDLPLVWWL